MVRNVNAPDEEPEESNFENPSIKEHLFQISDYKVAEDNSDIIVVKCEVIGGDEEGRSLLHRVNLDDKHKGFYYTRLFLKAIGEPYKGSCSIDETNWQGKQFYNTPVHNVGKNGKTYANLDAYNYDKMVEQVTDPIKLAEGKEEEIAWDEE